MSTISSLRVSYEASLPPAPPLPTKTYTTLVPKLEPFSRILGEKNSPFQPKSLILRSNKTPLFEAKRDFIFII